MQPNPFLLAADNSPSLLPLLQENPDIASAQDEHGYSLIHAAASYNHLTLLRALVIDFKVNVNLTDEDNETALFVVETTEAAKVLVEELAINPHHRGAEGLTAREKIEMEGDFPSVAVYLTSIETNGAQKSTEGDAAEALADTMQPPEGMKFTVSTIDETENVPSAIDPEFRRRIEELVQRNDFDAPSGQADLRKLVEDAISDQQLGEERSVRSKQT